VEVGLGWGVILVGKNPMFFEKKLAQVLLHLQKISITITLKSNQSLRDETPVTVRAKVEPEKC
jgi:hypothetical protein